MWNHRFACILGCWHMCGSMYLFMCVLAECVFSRWRAWWWWRWGLSFLIDLLSPFGVTLHLLLRLGLGLMRHSSSWDQHTDTKSKYKKRHLCVHAQTEIIYLQILINDCIEAADKQIHCLGRRWWGVTIKAMTLHPCLNPRLNQFLTRQTPHPPIAKHNDHNESCWFGKQ